MIFRHKPWFSVSCEMKSIWVSYLEDSEIWNMYKGGTQLKESWGDRLKWGRDSEEWGIGGEGEVKDNEAVCKWDARQRQSLTDQEKDRPRGSQTEH